jgi:hypothetical protein
MLVDRYGVDGPMRGENPSLNHTNAIEKNAVDEVNQRDVILETTAQVVVKSTMFPPGVVGCIDSAGANTT